MRVPRIHADAALAPGVEVALSEERARYVTRVLRLRPGAAVVLFDGAGGEYPGEVLPGAPGLRVRIGEHRAVERESRLDLRLVQGVSRGERMDYTIQKAVELGVTRLVPVLTSRSVVRLDARRLESRARHWRGIAIGACEQCGRNRIPEIAPAVAFAEWLAKGADPGLGLLLDPASDTPLGRVEAPRGPVTVLIGPEGGLEEAERAAARSLGFRGVSLGPRILRTETAAVAALAVAQARWGDLELA